MVKFTGSKNRLDQNRPNKMENSSENRDKEMSKSDQIKLNVEPNFIPLEGGVKPTGK